MEKRSGSDGEERILAIGRLDDPRQIYSMQRKFQRKTQAITSKRKVGKRSNETGKSIMGVWQGVAMDFLKFHPGPPCPTLLLPTFVSGVACPQSGRPAAIFYPFEHHTPYTYVNLQHIDLSSIFGNEYLFGTGPERAKTFRMNTL
jgi:hypothetical protein